MDYDFFESTEEYRGEQHVSIQYAENISTEHVAEAGATMGEVLDADHPVPELDITYTHIELDNLEN